MNTDELKEQVDDMTAFIQELYNLNCKMFREVADMEPVERPIAIMLHTKKQMSLVESYVLSREQEAYEKGYQVAIYDRNNGYEPISELTGKKGNQ